MAPAARRDLCGLSADTALHLTNIVINSDNHHMEPIQWTSYLIATLGAYAQNRFTGLLAPLGIRPPHYGVLRWIGAHPGATQQEIAGLMRLHRNVMVGIVDDLEAAGLVTRDRHPADRRAHALHLTVTAADLLREADAIADRLDAELLGPLAPDERVAFTAALRALSYAFEVTPGVFNKSLR